MRTYLEGRRLTLTSMGTARISREALADLTKRARDLGCNAGAVWGSRHGWFVTVYRDGSVEPTVSLRGKGQLSAVLAGALDDFEDTYNDDRPDDDDPGPSRLEREGLPEFNGAWRAGA